MKIFFAVLLCLMLTACSQKTVVPIAPEPDPTVLLVKPPEEAMKAPHEPVVAEYGRENSYYSGVMRQNNMFCADDREKLSSLQLYVYGIFNPTSKK